MENISQKGLPLRMEVVEQMVRGDGRSEEGALDCKTVVGGECWEAEIGLGCRTV